MENKETIACPHCLKEFTKRGMPNHLRACKAKGIVKEELPHLPPTEDELLRLPIQIVAVEPIVAEPIEDEVLQSQIVKRNEEILRRRQEYVNRLHNKHLNRDKRHDLLKHKLATHGCKLRDDSRLCWNYIESNIGNVDEIVEIMCEMKFYYEHTKYGRMLKRKLRKKRRNGDDYNYDDVSKIAKNDALELYCKPIQTIDEFPNIVPISLVEKCNKIITRNALEIQRKQDHELKEAKRLQQQVMQNVANEQNH
jgi:hypothetical protein